MRTILSVLAAGVVAVVLAACAAQEAAQEAADAPSEAPSDAELMATCEASCGAAEVGTLELSGGRYALDFGCNRIFGAMDPGALLAGRADFGQAASTKMACRGEAQQNEDAFLRALGASNGVFDIKRVGDYVELSSGDYRARLRLIER